MKKLNAKELESVSGGGEYSDWASQLRGMLMKDGKFISSDDATWSEITEYCRDILHSIAYDEDKNAKRLRECCEAVLKGDRRNIASAYRWLQGVE